ncbi:MAG: rhomboid family intramembrane serine protease, partial [Alphaproteobacteria bacterium]
MAFLQSGSAHQPVFRAPAVVLVLIALLAAVHAVRTLLLDPAASSDLIVTYGFIPGRYAFAGSFRDLAVPFVSYMALHGDWAHVAIN